MWPRVLMLLVVLLAPASSLAATVCCGVAATDACCEPEGGRPISEDGCDLAAGGETFKTALPGAGLPAPEPGLSVALAAVPSIVAESPPAREPARTPPYLLLKTLRN